MNTADGLIFQTEKQLKEFGEKIPADKKAVIEGALAKLKDAHKIQDVAGVDAALTELNNAWQAASEDLYKAQQQPPQGGPEAGAQPGGDGKTENVQDVPFEEVNDEKK